MSDNTQEMLREQVEGHRETIKDLMAALNNDDQDAIGRLISDGMLNIEPGEPHEDAVREALYEYPLEVVDERGREFAVVLGTGGPHVEVVADGLSSARIEGYWAGDRVTMHGDVLSDFLDYFIER